MIHVDNKKRYTLKEANKKIMELRQNFVLLNNFVAVFPTIRRTKTNGWDGFTFDIQVPEMLSGLDKLLREFTGELKHGTEGTTHSYFNENYRIWLFIKEKGVSKMSFSVKDGFTDYNIYLLFGCYVHGNVWMIDTHRSRSDKIPGETQSEKLKRLNKYIKKYHEEHPDVVPGSKATPEAESEPEVLSPYDDGYDVDWKYPKSIVEYLDHYVIGQYDAKKTMAVTFSNYMLRRELEDESIPIGHSMIIGPTGCGKTYMIWLLARKSGLIKVETTASAKSSNGYAGQNLSTIFQLLAQRTKKPAPYAIVFIDEIDKILRSADHNSIFPDILQDEIIGWIGGTDVALDTVSAMVKSKRVISTKNILFVFAGAFHKKNANGLTLYDIVKRRNMSEKVDKPKMGFGADISTSKAKQVGIKVRPNDLILYGASPELIGRMSGICVANKLSKDELVRILKTSKDSILVKQLSLLRKKGYKVETSEDLEETIVKYAPEETGARALDDITSDIFTEIVYDPESFINPEDDAIHINSELAEKLLLISRGKTPRAGACSEDDSTKAITANG